MLHVYSQDSILYEDKRFKTTNIPQSLRHCVCCVLSGIEAKRERNTQHKVSAKMPSTKMESFVSLCVCECYFMCFYIGEANDESGRKGEKEREKTQSDSMEKP